jgi:hypothetical protein
MPEVPKQELWVTLAGPAVNVVIAGGLYFVLVLRGTFSPHSNPNSDNRVLLGAAYAVERGAGAFQPDSGLSDGGRAFRALLAMRMPRTRYCAPVRTTGSLGLVTMENVDEFIAVQAARGAAKGANRSAAASNCVDDRNETARSKRAFS